ncbi:MAG: hypothetical protein FWC91_04320 [Defluviitaleaceae bacterium]|nr:hypothetical protein [Defluviitaleaceae bacterium]
MPDVNKNFFCDDKIEPHYTLIKKQIKPIPLATFSSPINILLITDRLWGYTRGLKEYMESVPGVSADLASDSAEADQIIQAKPIDFLIIVGYLKSKECYSAVKSFERINKFSCAIMYAILDEYIQIERLKYGINYEFSRLIPIEEFVLFMCDLYAKETQRMHQTVSPEATREQLRTEALQEQEITILEEEQLQEDEPPLEEKEHTSRVHALLQRTKFLFNRD